MSGQALVHGRPAGNKRQDAVACERREPGQRPDRVDEVLRIRGDLDRNVRHRIHDVGEEAADDLLLVEGVLHHYITGIAERCFHLRIRQPVPGKRVVTQVLAVDDKRSSPMPGDSCELAPDQRSPQQTAFLLGVQRSEPVLDRQRLHLFEVCREELSATQRAQGPLERRAERRMVIEILGEV